MTSRRKFLETSWKVGGFGLGVSAAWTAYESLRPLSATGAVRKIRIGDPANFATGTATYIPSGRLYVVNAKGNLFALSQKCPHLGCRIPFCESSGHFECPCHGSRFDLAGEWIEGPSPRGMDRVDLKLTDGTLWADTTKVTDGPDRGAKQFFIPAKGASCQGQNA